MVESYEKYLALEERAKKARKNGNNAVAFICSYYAGQAKRKCIRKAMDYLEKEFGQGGRV